MATTGANPPPVADPGRGTPAAQPVSITARWIEIADGRRTWRFERSFLLSHWRCIYGDGCCGIHPSQDPTRFDGCCTYGAHLSEAEDFVKVNASAARLKPEQWQHHRRAARTGWFKKLADGTVATRVVDGACVFLNRPGFATGPGCALHFAAMSDGDRPIDRKPDVCWELPLRCEDGTDANGNRTITVRRWERDDFGREGRDMTWWCTDEQTAPDAHTASAPVIDTLAEELLELCGPKVLAELRAALGCPDG